MNRTREELARHYLRRKSLSCTEISYLLGYEDPNSFFRAFHGWTGQTPEGARLELAQLGAGARAWPVPDRFLVSRLLVVHPYAVLPTPISAESLEVVAGESAQRVQSLGGPPGASHVMGGPRRCDGSHSALPEELNPDKPPAFGAS